MANHRPNEINFFIFYICTNKLFMFCISHYKVTSSNTLFCLKLLALNLRLSLTVAKWLSFTHSATSMISQLPYSTSIHLNPVFTCSIFLQNLKIKIHQLRNLVDNSELHNMKNKVWRDPVGCVILQTLRSISCNIFLPMIYRNVMLNKRIDTSW